jgi:hypothetical protein
MLGMDEHDLFPLSPSLITGSLIFFPRRGWCRCCLLEAVTVMAGSDTMVMTNDPGWMHVPNTVRRRAIHVLRPAWLPDRFATTRIRNCQRSFISSSANRLVLSRDEKSK